MGKTRKRLPVTAEFRKRLGEKAKQRGEKAKIARATGLSETLIGKLLSDPPERSVAVLPICEFYSWTPPEVTVKPGDEFSAEFADLKGRFDELDDISKRRLLNIMRESLGLFSH